MARPKSPLLEQLHDLAGDPPAQAAYAVTLLDGKQRKDVMQAALALLAARPDPQARQPILRLYARYAANKGVRDQGAYFRRALLEALRPLAVRADADLLAEAAATYEFWPPDFAEDAVLLRASALVVLSEVDDEQARFHAPRLLVDPYVQPMSGEPALTAARVLGALDELTVLWSYVFSSPAAPVAEVGAECLRQLVALPQSLLPAVLARFGEPATPLPLQLGLVHLLIHHHSGPYGRDFLRRRLLETRDADVYRYMAMSMIASGQEPLLADLLELAQSSQSRSKLEILAEAFDLLSHQPSFRQAAVAIHRRLQGKASDPSNTGKSTGNRQREEP